MADAAALEQALGHLLQNAVEASSADAAGDGPRRRRRRRASPIAITDKGVGMDADFVRNRLFQPFASTKPGGFGIGAFEARSLIAAMGGRLERRQPARPGHHLHHPACRPPSRPSEPTTETRMTDESELPVLLVVEDDEGLQRQLKWAYDGYRVVVAPATAPRRSRRCALHEPAVVTLDLGLPPDPDGTDEGFATLDGDPARSSPTPRSSSRPATARAKARSRRSRSAPMISTRSRSTSTSSA